jgi:hypothetical protein
MDASLTAAIANSPDILRTIKKINKNKIKHTSLPFET